MDRILSARAKIYRAKKHIDDLKPELVAFRELDSYRAHFYDDPNTGDRIGELQVVHDLPIRVFAIIGDAVHNLRSVLDHLAGELCVVSGGTIDNNTAFPIWDPVNVSDVDAQITRKIPRASAEVILGIKTLQPYKGGKGDILWRLHMLDIIDKHRLLIAGAAVADWIDLRYRRWEPDWLFPDLTRPIKLPPRGVAFKHGAKLLRVPRIEREKTTMNVDPKFRFQVAFGEVLEGEPVIPALDKFVDRVNDVISTFRGLLI